MLSTLLTIANLPTMGAEAGWLPNACKCDGTEAPANPYGIKLLCDDPALFGGFQNAGRKDWRAEYTFHTPNV